MTSCTVLSPDSTRADLTRLGGKGAGLARLIAEGFPVPPVAVVTADAYRAVVADQELAGFLRRLRSGGVDHAAAEVDAAFLAVPIAHDLGAEIVAAAARVAGTASLAIRSSATIEDLAMASLAGQYRSFLNVTGAEEILRAVRLVWASLWHPAPRAYRRAHGLADDDLAMAVVLMQMVPAVRAGVAFTVDPADAQDLRVPVSG